jgi:hypothetical protein
MKSYVLMSRKTGHLFEGVRVAFVSEEQELDALKGFAVVLVGEERGWLLYCPDAMGRFWIFFNEPGVTECFENLGEL